MSRAKRRTGGRRSKSNSGVSQPAVPARLTVPERDSAPEKLLDDDEDVSLRWGGEYPPAMILLAGEYAGSFQQILQRGLQAQGFQDVVFSDQVERAESCHLVCEFNGHVLRLLSLAESADGEAVQNALNAANCTREDKARMRAHRSHYFCQYLDGDPDVSAQLMAICQVALALEDGGVFALLDMEAWSCNPLLILRQLLQLESAEQLVANPPVELWGGFVKFFVDEQNIWFCSKAYHRWGVPDFAWYGQMPQAQEAYDLFRALFSYVRENGAHLKVGDTAQFGDNLLLRFCAVDADHDFLQGAGQTLVIERLNPASFH